jgi:RecA-family ATPase
VDEIEFAPHPATVPLAQRTSWTAAELLAADIPQPKWAIEGLLPEGLAFFAGAPKLGKSWFALGLGIAVASGGYALGKIPVDEGEILYLALEDNPRRLQSRLRVLLGDDEAPPACT